LRELIKEEKVEVINDESFHDEFMFTHVFSTEISNNINQWKNVYLAFFWFEDIYRLIIVDIVLDAHTFSKFLKYRVDFNFSILWKNHRDVYLFCISESMITTVLRHAHDECDHFQKENILFRLREQVYWFALFTNVERYISDCLECARHDSAQRFQLLHSIIIERSFQLLSFDFIDLLSKISDSRDLYIFHVIDYFSRFFITFSFKTVNASDVLSALERVFILYAISTTVYCDREQHFNNVEITEFLDQNEIFYSFNSFESSQSTEMMKIDNRLLKDILRKFESQYNWKTVLDQITKNLNDRVIRHLRISSSMILMKISSSISIMNSIFQASASIVTAWVDQMKNADLHAREIKKFLKIKQHLHHLISQRSRRKKNVETRRYNKEVHERTFNFDDLVMIYHKNTEKLKSRWRDLFQIKSQNDRDVFYSLQQLNDRSIKEIFHDNHLKLFTFRTDHFANSSNVSLSTDQIIRKFRKRIQRVISSKTFWVSSYLVVYFSFRITKLI
jgi:hypothetical protein